MNRTTTLRACGFPAVYAVLSALMAIMLIVVPLRGVQAELIVYRNSAAFSNAISGRATNPVNFDSTVLGTSLTNSIYQGLVFGANPNVTGNLIVTDGSPAVTGGLKAFSGTNFLGSDAGELITLGTNQNFSFSFQSNVSAVGFYFLSESQLGSGELGFRIGTTSAVIDTQNGNEIPLTGGTATPSFAYFVGIVDTNPLGVLTPVTVFGSANASPFGIDNIITAVPEPSSFVLIGLAIGGGYVGRFWRKKTLLVVRRTS